MVTTYQCVAKGHVPGIYLLLTHAMEQIEGFDGENHAGFDDIDKAVEYMASSGEHTPDNIYVFGKRGGKYTLRDWLRQNNMDTGKNRSREPSDTNVTVNSHVLGYIAGYIHQRPRDQIRDVIISQFSKDEINTAKSLLWDKCGHMDILNTPIHRVDSVMRGAHHAETEDIIDGIYKLYTLDTPPSFVISAIDVHRLPKCEPGELLEPSMLQRLMLVEAQMKQLHHTMDSTVTRCLQTEDRVTGAITNAQSSSYASTTASTKSKVTQSASPTNSTPYGPLTVKLPPLKPPQSRHAEVGRRDASRHDTSTISSKGTPAPPSDPSFDVTATQQQTAQTSDGSTGVTSDEFKLPRYAQRKLDRNNLRQVVRGTAPATGSLRGAPINPPNRDLFIYKVQKNVDNNELKNSISVKGFTIVEFKCVSHNEANFKSFQLTVPKAEFSRLFDANIWPEGICVRKFRTKRQD